VACGPRGDGPAVPAVPPLTFLGEAVIDPVSTVAGDPEIGGLSSLFHVGGDVYYAVSDDRGAAGPARFYIVNIAFVEGEPGGINASINGWEELFDADGAPLVASTYDFEGLVALDHNLFISSEGDVTAGVEPFVAVFGPQRRMMETLGLPAGFVPNADRSVGVRNNLAFESLALTPDARYLFTATESALVQDGPISTPDAGTLGRILRFDRDHGVFDAQFAYPIDPVYARSPIGALETNGVAELLALSADHLLVLERAFVAGVVPQHSIKLFEVCLAGATDISGIESLAAAGATFVPASKHFIADLADVVPLLDNVEGMAFGPILPSGDQTLIFVTDNNFQPLRQSTQILAFIIPPAAMNRCSPG